MLSASQAQELLPEYNMEHVREILRMTNQPSDELTVKTAFLGYLCSRGDLEGIKSFIRETDSGELRTVLNNRLDIFLSGTCLHQVLEWNTGNRAIEIFSLLVEHGAEFHRDRGGYYPWVVMLHARWFHPLVRSILLGEGLVNDEEQDILDETLGFLGEAYHLNQYEVEPIQDAEQPIEIIEDSYISTN